MGWRLVKKSEGVYNIFSTVVDDFVYTDCTEEEVYEIFREKAIDEANRETETRFLMLKEGIRVLTYEDAITHITRFHGNGEDE